MTFTSEFLVGYPDRVRRVFELAGVAFNGGHRGAEWRVLCPFHDDHHPSLDINIEKAVYTCRSCGASGDAVEFYAKREGLAVPDAIADLREKLGLEIENGGNGIGTTSSEPTGVYYYGDLRKLRFTPPGKKKFFVWEHRDGNGWRRCKDCGHEKPLYLLTHLLAADEAEIVYITESEKSADLLAGAGLIATTSGGASSWAPHHARQFPDGRDVVILRDENAEGLKYAESVAAALTGKSRSIRVVLLPGLPSKGGPDDFLAAGHTTGEIEAIAVSTPVWIESDTETDQDELGRSPIIIGKSCIEAERLSDIGNGRRFAREHGGAVRYCYSWESWLFFDGQRWTKDQCGEIERRAKDTVEAMYAEAAGLVGDERKELLKHALKSESAGRVTAMVALARSEVPVEVKDFDRDTWLLNVKNGTIDLRTGALREHRAEDFITKLAPVDYDPKATCPLFEAFLWRIFAGKRSLIDFVRRAAGYSLTGEISEQVILIPHGGGANGKTTLIEAITAMLGDYAQSTTPDTLMIKLASGGANEDVARMCGARFVSSSESEDGRRLAEAQIKILTGGDTVTARFMYGHFFDFRPTFTIWFLTNHKPTIRGQDEAIWRRIRLIPFDVTIPEAERVKDYFKSVLAAELPGILAWAVVGCLRWQAEGLNPPEDVQTATAQYRHEQDVVEAFIDDRCSKGEHLRETPGGLYKAFAEWSKDQGEKNVMPNNAFGRRLTDKGFKAEKARGRRWRVGLALATGNVPETYDEVTP